MREDETFRKMIEDILLKYIENTNDPEVGMNGKICTQYDIGLANLFFEGRLSAKEYVENLSDGGLYEALTGMHCHQYR